MRNPWWRVSVQAWLLSVEASSVIALRMQSAAGGTTAQDEASRMVREKIEAGLDLQAKAMSLGLGSTPAGAASGVLSHYRRKVKANRRRLMNGR